MDSLQDLFIAVMAVVTAVSVIITRFQETSSELGFLARAFKVFDPTQIFDSTRSLGDVPVDLYDGEDFDTEVDGE